MIVPLYGVRELNIDVNKDMEILTQKEYEELAIKSISLHGGKLRAVLMNSEDAISYVMFKLMIASYKWDKRISDHKLYLWYCGKYAVQSITTAWYKNSERYPIHKSLNEHLSVYQDNEDNYDADAINEMKNIIKNAKYLTKKEKEYSLLVADGNNFTEIATMYNVTRQNVQQLVSFATKKIRDNEDLD